MLKDRPALSIYVSKGDPVWDWAVKEFAGLWVKNGVQWDPTDPKPLWDALSTQGNSNQKAKIQVTEKSTLKNFQYGYPKTGPRLWYDVVFELCNLQFIKQVDQINALAYYGKISCEEYCFRRFYLEDVITRRAMHNFFVNVWVPNCKKRNLNPWDQFMIETNNCGVSVFSTKDFIKLYFSINYSGKEINPEEEDFIFHHNYYQNMYNQKFLPWMRKMKIIPPVNLAFPELEKKILNKSDSLPNDNI